MYCRPCTAGCLVLLAALVFVALVASARGESLVERFFRTRLDTDGSGSVDATEIVGFLKRMDHDVRVDPQDVLSLLARLDVNADGRWSLQEFVGAHWPLHVDTTPASPSSLGTDPKQVHLSVTGKPGQRVVMWVTSDNTTNSVVQWGTQSGHYTGSATGSTHTYTAGGWKGVIHQALMDGLLPDTLYYYRVGDSVHNVWSDEFSFRSDMQAPRPVVLAVYGDMGTTIPAGFLVARQLVEDHAKYHFDLVVHNGDLAYASTAMPAPNTTALHAEGDAPSPVGEEWEWVWDLFCDQIAPLARQVPYITGVGNHEKFFDYSSYLNRFSMPSPWGMAVPGDTSSAKFWFSVEYGPVHILLMSTEHDYCPGSEQYAWMEADLEAWAARRQQVPWLLVTGHRPMYCTDTDEWDSHRPGAPLQTCLEPLMQRYGADMYLCGHMHIYERIHPVLNGTTHYGNTSTEHQVYVNPGMPVHAVQATAGVFQDHSWVTPSPDYSAVRLSKFGYGRITLYNATHLHYEFSHLESNTVIDDFWIVKQ